MIDASAYEQDLEGLAEVVVDRRLYLDRSRSRICEEGDSDAAYLLAAGRGYAIPQILAEALGYRPDPELAKRSAGSGGR